MTTTLHHETSNALAPGDRTSRAAAGASGSATVLQTKDLTKQFGSVTAVNNLSFEMRAGEVLGFLGPNGAGKSTTVGMLLGLVYPTKGDVSILGKDLASNPEVVSDNIGAIIENPAFYPFLSGRDNLRALGMMAGGVPEARIEYLLKLVNLDTRADGKYKTFSLGMKQRLGLAATLLTNPEIVILDEPTNGLDPAGQREVRALIPRLADEGHSIFLASHLLNDVERVADRICIIRNGELITEGTMSELLSAGGYFEIRVSQMELDQANSILASLPFVDRVSEAEDSMQVYAPPDSGSEINRSLSEHGIYASQLTMRQNSLESLFIDLTEGSENNEG